MQAGKSSIQFEHPPIITSAASIVGQTEGEGPLASFFDRVEPDPTFGKKSWEEAESELQVWSRLISRFSGFTAPARRWGRR